MRTIHDSLDPRSPFSDTRLAQIGGDERSLYVKPDVFRHGNFLLPEFVLADIEFRLGSGYAEGDHSQNSGNVDDRLECHTVRFSGEVLPYQGMFIILENRGVEELIFDVGDVLRIAIEQNMY